MRTAVSFPSSLKGVLGERPQTYLENTQEKLCCAAQAACTTIAHTSRLSSEKRTFILRHSLTAQVIKGAFELNTLSKHKNKINNPHVCKKPSHESCLGTRRLRSVCSDRNSIKCVASVTTLLWAAGGNNWKMTNGILEPRRLVVARCRSCLVTAELTFCCWNECCQNTDVDKTREAPPNVCSVVRHEAGLDSTARRKKRKKLN